MGASWVEDLTEANRDFMNLVLPVITPACGGGTFLPVEVMRDNEIAQDLDLMAGVDVWQRIDGEGVRGIAARVQQGSVNWGTFTIRQTRTSGAQTEYEKRKMAIESGRYIYPYLTCQAYVNNGELIGVGLAKTEDVFSAIDVYGWPQTNPHDGNTFLCVKFSAVNSCKYR